MDTSLEIKEKQDLIKIANEDWPMLEELAKNRFVIKTKKSKDMQVSIDALETVMKEEEDLNSVQIQKVIVMVEDNKIISKEIEQTVSKVEDEKIVVAKEVVTTPSSQTEKLATTISQPTVGSQVQDLDIGNVSVNNIKSVKNESEQRTSKIVKDEFNEGSIALIGLVLSGFTHLYVSKTANLLVPLKFVMKHYKEVLIASMYVLIPLLMTYFLTSNIKFVAEQLVKETLFMKGVYYGIFFLASTFVWITGQVLLSGVFSMIRKSMIDVAKVGKENQ